jgi:hypothetical protein
VLARRAKAQAEGVSPGTAAPRLVALDGRLAHASWDIPPGLSTIGREPTTGIVVDDESVSRRHASVARDGGHVVLTDLRSTNGTWINDQRLYGARELRAGDMVRLGQVSMAFESGAPSSAAASFGFGDVGGPVNAGSGRQYIAGRDQHVGDRIHYDRRTYRTEADTADGLFEGRGFGRVLIVVGGLICLAGFAMFTYVIFSAMGGSIDDPIGQSPFAIELLPGVPMLPVGFGAFAVGGIIASIGSAMSRAANKRYERRQGHD